MDRLIFHVDVNSAFLSWEAARRVSEGKEDLREIPSAISGDPLKRTGVILAKSIPAKRYGVRTGEPVSAALRKCPGLVLARPDFSLYERNSRAFMEICRRYAPVVEKFSIDECFLDMSGTDFLYPDPIRTAHEIKDCISRELGFTVNVGVSRCKLLAKMASDFEKPDRVHTLFPEELADKFWPLPVGELFLVGASSAEKLRRVNIRTIGDLAQADASLVQKAIGGKFGRQLQAYARGEDDTPVSDQPEDAKGYSVSTTLEEDVEDAAQARQVLLVLADHVAGRLRADAMRCSCVAVTIRSRDFKNRSHQRQLPEATDLTDEIFETAVALFRELWDGKTPLRLLSIALTELEREGEGQLSLFAAEDREKSRRRDRAVDAIRGKFGAATIQRGSALESGIRVGKKRNEAKEK